MHLGKRPVDHQAIKRRFAPTAQRVRGDQNVSGLLDIIEHRPPDKCRIDVTAQPGRRNLARLHIENGYMCRIDAELL
jgi:hypothetical protein